MLRKERNALHNSLGAISFLLEYIPFQKGGLTILRGLPPLKCYTFPVKGSYFETALITIVYRNYINNTLDPRDNSSLCRQSIPYSVVVKTFHL